MGCQIAFTYVVSVVQLHNHISLGFYGFLTFQPMILANLFQGKKKDFFSNRHMEYDIWTNSLHCQIPHDPMKSCAKAWPGRDVFCATVIGATFLQLPTAEPGSDESTPLVYSPCSDSRTIYVSF